MKTKNQNKNILTKTFSNFNYFFVLFAIAIFTTNCSSRMEQNAENSEASAEAADPMKDKGIGPVTKVELGELNPAMAEEGKAIYASKCSACHKIDVKFVGPPQTGVTKKRSPEWIMNMILNPEEMTQKNPAAMALLAEFTAPMANQHLTQEEARKILEYFRQVDAGSTAQK